MKNINKPKKGISKTNNKDKNGFTLVELLAVIVVLAMLVLIAGRAVTGQITKAKRNTFRTETIEFAKGMLDYYDLANVEESTPDDGLWSQLFYWECKTLQELKDEGYIEFSSTSGYSGYLIVIQAKQLYEGDPVFPKSVFGKITNGKYMYLDRSNKWTSLERIVADKKFDLQIINETGEVVTSICPEDIDGGDALSSWAVLKYLRENKTAFDPNRNTKPIDSDIEDDLNENP